jgi:proteasome lid subunit RPN8/RPN11
LDEPLIMSDREDFTYAALITISVPANGQSITVPVVLTPRDAVPLDGQNKVLAECTLADLQRYATELQQDIWDAYEAISLLDLDQDEAVAVHVAPGSDPDASVEGWTEHLLVLLDEAANGEEEDAVSTPVETGDGTGVEEKEEPLFVADQLTRAVEPAVDSETSTPLADESQAVITSETVSEPAETTDDTDVAVAETELVYPEIEEEIAADEISEKARPRVPDIIPSKARVRVAGARLPVGHPTPAAVDILMDEPALRAAQAHALSSMSREVAGVLVGPRPEKQPDGRYLVHIFDTIVAKHTVMQGASVTYTPESWRYLSDTLLQRYPDDTAVMVGWYHTHPGFGIFLSGMDLFIHQNFFTQIWHVAMVLDPRARSSGFFCWNRARTQVSRFDFAWPSWAADSW